MKKLILALLLLPMHAFAQGTASESICTVLAAPLACSGGKVVATVGTTAGTLADGGALAATTAEAAQASTAAMAASSAANGAAANASAALSGAQQAGSSASAAGLNATEALSTANTAQTTATQATNVATTAQQVAQQASVAATAAGTQAQNAQSLANTAETTAQAAQLYADVAFGLSVAAGSNSLASATLITHQYSEYTTQGTGGSINLPAFDKVYTLTNDTNANLVLYPPMNGQFQTAAGLSAVGATVTIYSGSYIQIVPASNGILARVQ